MTPERDGAAVETSELVVEGGAAVLIDGTERRRQRPRDGQAQKDHYSGKKAHTDKNLVLVNTHSQKVVYLSPTQVGKKHAKKQADEATIVYALNTSLGKEAGFQGYAPANVSAWQPKKKPKGCDLEVADKFLNAMLSSARIVVEHGLAGVKRCHIVKDVFRNTRIGFSDRVMEVACALHNLRVHFRHPIPDLKLVALLDPYSE